MHRFYRGDFFKSGKRWRHVVWILAGLLFLLLFVGGDNGCYQIWRQKKYHKKLEKDLQVQQAESSKLQKECDALSRKDPAIIEKKAREELGMVKKGEEVYQVIIEGATE